MKKQLQTPICCSFLPLLLQAKVNIKLQLSQFWGGESQRWQIVCMTMLPKTTRTKTGFYNSFVSQLPKITSLSTTTPRPFSQRSQVFAHLTISPAAPYEAQTTTDCFERGAQRRRRPQHLIMRAEDREHNQQRHYLFSPSLPFRSPSSLAMQLCHVKLFSPCVKRTEVSRRIWSLRAVFG